jgi:hypothetical protein
MGIMKNMRKGYGFYLTKTHGQKPIFFWLHHFSASFSLLKLARSALSQSLTIWSVEDTTSSCAVGVKKDEEKKRRKERKREMEEGAAACVNQEEKKEKEMGEEQRA